MGGIRHPTAAERLGARRLTTRQLIGPITHLEVGDPILVIGLAIGLKTERGVEVTQVVLGADADRLLRIM